MMMMMGEWCDGWRCCGDGPMSMGRCWSCGICCGLGFATTSGFDGLRTFGILIYRNRVSITAWKSLYCCYSII